MKIIKPYARLLAPWAMEGHELLPMQKQCGIDAMKYIEWCARISHRAEEAQTGDSWKRFVDNVVMKHGDWSVVEHVSVSVDSVTDRGITHEWVRHRITSYTQESTRFVNYELKMPPSFIYPQIDVECRYCLYGSSSVDGNGNLLDDWLHMDVDIGSGTKFCSYDPSWLRAIQSSENEYKSLLSKKWRPQEARSVFPNALASRIITTTNLRAWRHFLIMRTSMEAHPQMRQVTIPLLKEFQETFPLIFDDIIPNEKQSIAMRKAQ